MSEFQNNINNEEEEIDFSSILNILLGKWYWFLASALLFISLGAAYLYFTPKTYSRSATILIKDSKNGAGANMEAMAFADIAGLSGLSVSNAENEMQILKSRFLMENVVTKLGANITYSIRENLRSVELYENAPFKIKEVMPGTLMPADFTVELINNDQFKFISEDTVFTGKFNEELQFPFGVATIENYPLLQEIHQGEEINVSIESTKKVVTNYLKVLQANLVSKNASMVEVRFSSSRPGKATDVLNTLLELYNQETINDKNLVLDNTQSFIEDRLSVIRRELGDVDSRIEGYKRSSRSTNILTESQIYLQSASKLEETISETELQASLVGILAEFLSKPQNKGELLPYNIGLDNAGLNAQIQNYNDNIIKMNRLLAASSERNPVVADMGVSLETARRSIEKTVADMQKSVKMQLKELSSRNALATGRIEAVATNERSVQSIERDQKIKAELYLYLLNKSEENAILKSMTEANARIIDRAFGEDMPIKPKKSIILLACMLIGCIIPAAYFILKDLLYTKVRGRADVTKIISAPVLGEIPAKPEKHANDYIVVHQGSNTQVSEAFRILRTNLGFMNIGRNHQVISTTSTQPGEGKTYVSGNMAMALALSGKKVCLVGLDLRRPTMQAEFGLKGRSGVTEFLANRSQNLSELIHQTSDNENLFILPAGTVPPNPAELLMSSRFDEMVKQLRDKFDYVILDNPPMDIVADTGIANRVTDLSLYVIRAGVLDRRQLVGIEQIYKEQKLTNMGIVITDVDYERLYYSVGYKGYGKRYGYSGSDNGYYS
ncbi:MAG: polysaccharide biosynthesis tyrosine autokinase [Bacteroidales bacterium]